MTALPRNLRSSTELPDARWLRSSYSTGANNCVETARPHAGPWTGLLAVRDSKDPAGQCQQHLPEPCVPDTVGVEQQSHIGRFHPAGTGLDTAHLGLVPAHQAGRLPTGEPGPGA